ncbi:MULTISPECIES: hypothetical protein [Sphingobacterium]|uniref:DUF4369 domain-containing protein n=1 Tax=Sphingobacterium populi TaxID=1812824 RepID=A0ABW5UG98_9SPHI|nr:hypothetical protein [Sphingobacterium sp. CFCC 11742]
MGIKQICVSIGCTLFLGTGSYAQTVQLSVALSPDMHNEETIDLYNESRNLRVSIPSSGKSTYKQNINLPDKGFYMLEQVGKLYLAPKNSLQITSDDTKQYIFKGKQATENELLAKLAVLRQQMLPENTSMPGVPTFKLLKQSVPDFLITVDAYKTAVAELVNSSEDSHFKELVIGDADSYSRVMLQGFSGSHGADSVLHEQAQLYFQNPASKNDPNYSFKHLRMRILPYYDDFLNEEDLETVRKAYTDHLDLNDKDLLQNSPSYAKIVSIISFSDMPIDEKRMQESYDKRFESIPEKFEDEQFVEEMQVQQGAEYLHFLHGLGLDIEGAYSHLKSLVTSQKVNERIDKLYAALKKPNSI